MRRSQLAIAFDIPFLKQICQTLIAIFHFFILRDALEDLAILFIRRITDLDFMPQTSQEGFVYEVLWGEISREYDQNVEGHFNFTSIVKRKKIYTIFERDNPTVKQITRAYLLTSKVIDEKNPTIRFDLERRLI